MKLRIIRNIEPYEYHCFPCLSQEVTYADLASIVSKKDSMEFLQEKLYKIIFNQHLNKMTWSVCVYTVHVMPWQRKTGYFVRFTAQQDIVPKKIKYSEYLQILEKENKEEDDLF